MGRRGPAPKPAEVKLLQGNPGKRRIKPSVKPAPTKVCCPAWLSDEAKAEWMRLSPELERLGLLTILDAAALAIYCDSWAAWAACQKLLNEKGRVYVAAAGKIVQRPEVALAQQYAQSIRAFGVEFGLTPNSRARLNVEPQDESEDEFDRWLSGRGRSECPRCTLPRDMCGCR